MKQVKYDSTVETVTPKQFLKIKNNTRNPYSSGRPRPITINGRRWRVHNHHVLGVFYHRGPKLLVYLFGVSPTTEKAT